MEFVELGFESREQLARWLSDGVNEYIAQKNHKSIDGLPGLD